MEFKPFPKIERVSKSYMTVTQKIHGTNAQVFIYDTATLGPDGEVVPIKELKVGSRTRWITPEDDNFGFAKFVYENKQEFIDKLGIGQHFGEWAGPGINSGEGLKEKTFILFDRHRYPPERALPPRTTIVPLLHSGPVDLTQLPHIMQQLKEGGSSLVPGFMRPEGIVVQVFGTRLKMVFDAEETSWTKGDGNKEKIAAIAADPKILELLQPIRLQKLLSRDEAYIRDYPETLPKIASDYVKDLIEEGQIAGTEDEIKATKKALGSHLFKFIKQANGGGL